MLGEWILDRLHRAVKRGIRNQDGNVAIIFAFSLPLVIGGAGIGVETTYWYFKDLQLQAAADAGAYAGALEKRSGSSKSIMTVGATAAAVSNGFKTSIGTIVVNSPPTSGPNTGQSAVEVILEQPVQRFFTRFFSGTDTFVENARAVVKFKTAADACVLALNPSASKAALFSGSATTTFTNCSIMANSIADDALTVQGTASVNASCFISSGGVSMTTGAHSTSCTNPITQAAPVADPFEELPTPADGGNCLDSGGATLQPGNYCSGLSINDAKTLNPGTYIISGGTFKLNANAVLSGAGVTIYLAGGARVSINGNATVNLSAPIDGPYSGVLFFSDRNNTGGSGNVFNGTAQSKMTGAIYARGQQVKYLGNFSGENGCLQIVADTVEWSGNTSVAVDCSAHGMQTIPAGLLLQLAE